MRHYDEKVAQEYDEALRLRPNDSRIQFESHRSAGYRFVKLGQFGRAAIEFSAASRLNPADELLSAFVAVTQLATGDKARYRQTCAAMYQRLKRSDNRRTLYLLAWTCSIGPDSIDDMTQLIPAAESAARWWIDSEQVLVGVYCRAGKYQEAIDCLQRPSHVYQVRATTLFFAAMANYRLVQMDLARTGLADGFNAVKIARGGGWDELLAGDLVREEAERLILNGR